MCTSVTCDSDLRNARTPGDYFTSLPGSITSGQMVTRYIYDELGRRIISFEATSANTQFSNTPATMTMMPVGM
jgi:hypothetical protein